MQQIKTLQFELYEPNLENTDRIVNEHLASGWTVFNVGIVGGYSEGYEIVSAVRVVTLIREVSKEDRFDG